MSRLQPFSFLSSCDRLKWSLLERATAKPILATRAHPLLPRPFLPSPFRSVKSLSPLYPLLSSISSDGFINLYDLTLLPQTPTLPLTTPANVPVLLPQGQYDTKGTRLTCVTMAEGERGVEGVDEEDVEGNEEEWGGIGSDSDEEESEEESEEEEEFSGEEMEEEMEGEE